MPGGMAIEVDRHRQAGNMTGGLFYVDGEGAYPPAEALGADAAVVYRLKNLLFPGRGTGVGMGRISALLAR